MNEEHGILEQVYAAKESVQAADQLIGDYLPFIRAETAKFLKRPPEEGRDDELSIAMIAFHEAIGGYAKHRGSFLKYASMLIRSRLIDYARKERRHRQTVSLDAPAAGEESASLGETLPEERDHPEESAHRQATRQEIEELSRQMESFGVSLSDVADNCPKQQRTLQALSLIHIWRRRRPWPRGTPRRWRAAARWQNGRRFFRRSESAPCPPGRRSRWRAASAPRRSRPWDGP